MLEEYLKQILNIKIIDKFIKKITLNRNTFIRISAWLLYRDALQN